MVDVKVRIPDIELCVIYGEEEFILKTYTSEYRNLMMLIYDKIFIDDFGECGGQGRCATCVVEILECKHSLSVLERNEEYTLKRAGYIHSDKKLSCQILVDKALHQAKIKIYSAF